MTVKPVLSLLSVAIVFICLHSYADVPPDAVWIDVRTPGEYAGGHLEGAVSIPFDGIEAGVAKLQLPRDAAIYLYCASGRRAGMAKERLEAQDYSDVTNVGGLDDARALVTEPTTYD